MASEPSNDTTGLEASSIYAGYSRHRVLHDVSVNLNHGDTIAVIGPNGAGKSTLLKVLAGTLRPDRGAVSLDGRPLAQLGPRQAAHRIAVVPQKLTISFGLTAREVVMMGRTPYLGFLGSPSVGDRAAVHQALLDTDTLPLANRVFATLSGGEAQRVVLAMALAQETDYLLLDEPTVHLDLGQQWKFIGHLMELRARRHVGILAIVHDLTLAGTAFDRVILLNHGRVIADGSPREVLTKASISREFGAPVHVWHDENGTRVGVGL
jgi:iron complex transport system ATP-binding protein